MKELNGKPRNRGKVLNSMKIKDFFTFRSKLVSSTVQVGAINQDYNRRPLENIELSLGDDKGIDFPIIFIHKYGYKWTDILDTGYASLYLISDKLKNLLEENQITGWKTFPVKVLDKKKREVPGYHGFSVTGRCGPIDDSKALIIEKRLVPTGPICKYCKGLYVGLDQWNGTDFFVPEKTLFIIVTNRTADLLQKNKITNLELENLTEVEMDIRICFKE